MDLRWLNDFLAVAETGSFTRAAETRHTSQAAFSRRIQSLEAWLGTTLIDRAVFPTRLTPQGERFRDHAGDILRGIEDARGEARGEIKQDHVRIAVPYALATSSMPDWWAEWSAGTSLACSLVVGNIHDMMSALVSGGVDLLICFHAAHQPIRLDEDRFERLDLRSERLRPYASQELIDQGLAELPGRIDRPIPLLMYSQGVYFNRMIEFLIESAPQKLIGRRVMDSDMSDVLRAMAGEGHGVAWLADCSVRAARDDRLVPIDDGRWSTSISTVALRSHANDRPAVHKLWARVKAGIAIAGANGVRESPRMQRHA